MLRQLATFSENCVIPALATLSQYTRFMDRRQTTDDRQHIMTIPNFATQLQLQYSAKNAN